MVPVHRCRWTTNADGSVLQRSVRGRCLHTVTLLWAKSSNEIQCWSWEHFGLEKESSHSSNNAHFSNLMCQAFDLCQSIWLSDRLKQNVTVLRGQWNKLALEELDLHIALHLAMTSKHYFDSWNHSKLGSILSLRPLTFGHYFTGGGYFWFFIWFQVLWDSFAPGLKS